VKDLSGRVAVITGGGSGIGRGMALAFADAGMHVVIADIDRRAAHAVAEEVAACGVDGLAFTVDVAERSSLEGLAERAYGEFGAVHLLCNNAGVTTFGFMCNDLSDEDWRWVIEVNLFGVINGLQAFLPRMRAQEGEKHVVNTASIAGVNPVPMVAPYVASKYAVVGISESLRMEGAGAHISCSVLCPGNVDTQIAHAERNRPQHYGEARPGNAFVEQAVAEGMDPLLVGRIVRRAVIDDEMFIFTHPETRLAVEQRGQGLLAGYDRAEEWLREEEAG
jgi:NAD(P)-dependent dehydrogenase (short-subunit alcohol dehydrogenase family)